MKSPTHFYYSIVIQFTPLVIHDWFALYVDRAFALVSDVKIPIVLQFDQTLFSRDFRRWALERQIHIYGIVLRRPTQSNLYVMKKQHLKSNKIIIINPHSMNFAIEPLTYAWLSANSPQTNLSAVKF